MNHSHVVSSLPGDSAAHPHATMAGSVPALLRVGPIYMERVWGGRELESRYDRELPAEGVPYGESWEVVDRPGGEQSVVISEGPLRGRTLHDMWTGPERAAVFGEGAPESERFPILIKILDARETLSLQVHPPVGEAAALGGEPKTEMWVIAAAEPGAKLYAGVKPGTTREVFAHALAEGTVAGQVPELAVREGDFIFIPSGRLHAIGAGLLIFEIQQNSDTTYRVFDWNRMGLDGKPRTLHVEESLRCIDFTDTAPALGRPDAAGLLAACPYFKVHRRQAAAGEAVPVGKPGGFLMPGILSGQLEIDAFTLNAGDWALVTASAGEAARTAVAGPEGAVWVEAGF